MNSLHPVNLRSEDKGTCLITKVPTSLWKSKIMRHFDRADFENLERVSWHFKDLIVHNNIWSQFCTYRTDPEEDPFKPEIEKIANIYDKSALYHKLLIQRQGREAVGGNEAWRLDDVPCEEVLSYHPLSTIGESPFSSYASYTAQLSLSRNLELNRTVGKSLWDWNWKIIVKDPKGTVAKISLPNKDILGFYQSPNGILVQWWNRKYSVLKTDLNKWISQLSQLPHRADIVKARQEKIDHREREIKRREREIKRREAEIKHRQAEEIERSPSFQNVQPSEAGYTLIKGDVYQGVVCFRCDDEFSADSVVARMNCCSKLLHEKCINEWQEDGMTQCPFENCGRKNTRRT